MVTLSQLIVAIGGWIRVFWVMLLGRALFGVASENLIIAQNVIITSWFKGNELSTVLVYIEYIGNWNHYYIT